jgi:hypothetical protein
VKCVICSRKIYENKFCHLHFKAYTSILEKFRVWQKATSINWEDYLCQIQKNSLTGEWAKEVAKYLIEEEEKKCLEK